MAVTRTHFTFRIDVWTANGESIVEHGRLRRGFLPRRFPGWLAGK